MDKPKVILDSGAFTAHRKGKKIKLSKYISFLKEHGDEYEDYFNLDVIGAIQAENIDQHEGMVTTAEKSYINWKRIRKQGLNPIPVYHVGTDVKWLEKYLEETDYIGLGAIASLDTVKRQESLGTIWDKYFLNKDGTAKVRVHGLGLTHVDIMSRFPWFSVDSFTPVISAVWGSILLPLIRDGKPLYTDMSIYRISDQAQHKVGITGSYLNLPTLLKKQYGEMIEENKFVLGEITHKVIRPRRRSKNKEVVPPARLFEAEQEDSNTELRTLANHWEERMRWNLVMWTKLRKVLPNIRMYMGVSTTTHLEIFNKVKPKLDILISYAYLTPPIEKMIKEYTK